MINRDKSKREQNDVTNLQYYSINDTVVQVAMTTREGKLAAKTSACYSLTRFYIFYLKRNKRTSSNAHGTR